MKYVLWLFWVMAMPTFAEGLPAVKVEPSWQQCTVDSDCDIVRDACRSCGEPIALNKKFISDYLKVDYAQRKTAGLMMSCEACSQQNLVVRCENNQCKGVR